MNSLLLVLPAALAAGGVAAWRLAAARRRAAALAAERDTAARTALLDARRAAGLPTGPEPARPPLPSTPASTAPTTARAPAMPTGLRPAPAPRPPEAGAEARPSARTQAERVIAAEIERRQAALEKARNIAAAEARRAAQALERTEPMPRLPAAAQPAEPVVSPKPAVVAKPAPVAPVVAKAPAAPRPVYKTDAQTLILMVDDSKMVRVKTSRLLEANGFQVVTAVDGVDAIAQLGARRPDLVITDVDMPHLDGFGLARHLRADPATARLPIVMITSAEDRHREPALALGVGLVLGKPYPEDELVAHIRAQRFIAPAVAEAVPA